MCGKDHLEEVWKPVQGYEGYYNVSNLGNVYSLLRTVIRSDGLSCQRGGYLLQHTMNSDGYPTVHLSKNGVSERIPVHVLVARAFVDNPNGYKEVNHKDFDRTNCRSDNLEWITHRDNVQYTVKAGRHASRDFFGSKNPNFGGTKLKEYFLSHPEERMRLARPGRQNGRCVPVTLIDSDGNKKSFDYLSECAEYMMNTGLTSARNKYNVAYRISVAKRNGTEYKHCQFI